MTDTTQGDFAHDSDGKPVYFAPTPDPTTPPPWTWWLRPGGAMWFISDTRELRFRNAGGRESEGVVSLSWLDSHYGRESPETCPARPRSATDAPVGTVWRGRIHRACVWKLKPDGTLDYSTDGGLTWGAPNVCSVADLETDKKSVERLPLGTKPTTDAASRAIAAHTTPGKTGENPDIAEGERRRNEVIDRFVRWHNAVSDAYRTAKSNDEVAELVRTIVSGDWSKSDPPAPAAANPSVVDPLIGGILSAFFPFARESVQVAESIRKAETLGEAEYVLNRYAAKVREKAINDCAAAVMRQIGGDDVR